MSLLLDARRKQQAQQGAGFELSLVEPPNLAAPDRQSIKNIRDAGQNLFGAKSSNPLASHTGIRRKLLVALCGAILLFAAAAGYYWPIVSANNTQPLHPSASAPILRPIPSAAAAEFNTQNIFSAEPVAPHSADSMPKPLLTGAVLPADNQVLTIPARENNPVRMEGQKTGTVDPLLNNAYLSYRNGNLDAAQQLYREMLGRDAHNIDAWLGLAVIAQQRGEDMLAAQYYSRVLTLDPRNALAHAGTSALTADGSDESRLETLLNEQQDSAVLHFALGNRYAEQSRWGEAQQAYFNAYTLELGNIEFAFNLAVSLDHLGQSKLAAQYYQRALQLDQQESNPGFDHAQTEQRVLELAR